MTEDETRAETETRKIDRIVGAAEPVGIHPRWRDHLDYVLATAVIFLVIGMVVLWFVATEAKKESDVSSGKVDKVSSALNDANAQILRLGGTPVKTPPKTPADITDAQVLDAVAAYFSHHPVSSPRIDYSLLHAYVVDYLVQHPAAKGKSGSRGVRGPSGAPGSEGPVSSPEMLSSAVADYFRVNPPQPGPPGPTGPSGSSVTGPPGRGITSVNCTSTFPLDKFTFTLTFSDGTTQTVTCMSTNSAPSPTP